MFKHASNSHQTTVARLRRSRGLGTSIRWKAQGLRFRRNRTTVRNSHQTTVARLRRSRGLGASIRWKAQGPLSSNLPVTKSSCLISFRLLHERRNSRETGRFGDRKMKTQVREKTRVKVTSSEVRHASCSTVLSRYFPLVTRHPLPSLRPPDANMCAEVGIITTKGDTIMTTLTIQEAQAQLADLIHRLVPGDDVVITDNDLPVARLVSTSHFNCS
jgi:prevent-host-death family protein